MTQLRVMNAQRNPFQTRGIIEGTVLDLMISIKSTSAGYWDNNLGSPPIGVEIPDTVGMTVKEERAVMKDFEWVNVYGQQRIEALRRLKIEWIDIPLKPLTEREMLVICANENLEIFGGDLVTTTGAVKQVYDRTNLQLDQSKTWTIYQKKGFDMISSKTLFDNAKKQGIGYKLVQSILGDSWKINMVRGALTAVRAMEEGLFTTEDIVGFSSLDGVKRFAALARKILDLDYPTKYKREMIDNCIVVIIKHGASGKTIDLASGGLDEGYDPVRYVKDQMPINLEKLFMKKVRALLADGKDPKDTYSDIMPEIIKEAQDQIDKAAKDEAARLKKAEAGTDDSGDPPTSDDLKLKSDEPPLETGGDDLFGGDSGASTKDSKLISFNMSIPVFVSELDGVMSVIDETVKDEETIKNIALAFTSATKLYAIRFGYKALRSFVTKIQKTSNGD